MIMPLLHIYISLSGHIKSAVSVLEPGCPSPPDGLAIERIPGFKRYIFRPPNLSLFSSWPGHMYNIIVGALCCCCFSCPITFVSYLIGGNFKLITHFLRISLLEPPAVAGARKSIKSISDKLAESARKSKTDKPIQNGSG